MITAITLENFKGISAAATIPLRPLTILFGKNSAGKSTVVQALHYAREIFERNNLNADRTLLGGSSVDLGGFRNLVNNHEYDKKAITMRFDMDLRDAAFPEYDFAEHLEYKRSVIYGDNEENESTLKYENDLSRFIETAAVELKVEWSSVLDHPVITGYRTWINDVEAVQVEVSIDEKDVRLLCNHIHPVLYLAADDSIPTDEDEVDWTEVEIYSYEEAIPKKAKPLIMATGQVDEVGYVDDLSLTQMLVAPTDLLREWLDGFRYIGPLRATPPRNFQPTLTQEESDWANGLAAWRELYKMDDFFFAVELIAWLGEKLKTGYIVQLKQFREIPLSSSLMLALMKNTVFDDFGDTATIVKQYPIQKKLVLIEEKSRLEVMPNDIGVGISQVMPVIVASLVSNRRLIAIEQPELHLHPAMQAELGDLFIESALGNKKNLFLIETHSEHLILRILRRIRECAEGEKEDPSSPSITPEDVQLIYVEPAKEGTVFYNLTVTKEGDFAENVPGGFFAERARELF